MSCFIPEVTPPFCKQPERLKKKMSSHSAACRLLAPKQPCFRAAYSVEFMMVETGMNSNRKKSFLEKLNV